MSKSILPAGANRGRPPLLYNLARPALASLAMSMIAIALGGNPAGAQASGAQASGAQASGPQDSGGLGHPQIFVTPYLWLAGVYATTATPLARIPEVNSSVGPFELLGHLDGAPFMGSAEIHDGPLSLLFDMLHVPVSTNITTRNVLFQGGKAELQANSGTALLLYRLLESPNQFADLGVGFRAWGFGANVELNPGLLAGQSVDQR